MYIKIEKELPGIKKNVSLKEYTTFKIGGRAKYFLEVKSKEDLIKAVISAKKFKLPFFILGNGSNTLVSDKRFNGLVIKIKNHSPYTYGLGPAPAHRGGGLKLKIKNSTIKTDAGVSLSGLINISVEKRLTGLEWAIGIPGTVGGAVFGNAGAFKKDIGGLVNEVEVCDIKNEKIKILRKKDCKFGYRDSIFKHKKNLIILSAKIQLKKGKKEKIQKKIKGHLDYRKATQPLNFPSAGSIFQNPPKFSAGELIENCGLKGKRIGGAKISEKHANFIVNLGNAKAADVKQLINLAKKKVKNKFKIKLEEEIQYL